VSIGGFEEGITIKAPGRIRENHAVYFGFETGTGKRTAQDITERLQERVLVGTAVRTLSTLSSSRGARGHTRWSSRARSRSPFTAVSLGALQLVPATAAVAGGSFCVISAVWIERQRPKPAAQSLEPGVLGSQRNG
jgi:hypothetical protein